MNKAFEQNIKNLLRKKFTGFKRMGGLAGGLAGSGIGGTMGMMDAIKSDRAGEMEGLGAKEKIKAYLDKMIAPGVVGLGGGAALGIGGGEALRRMRANQHLTGLKKGIREKLLLNPKIKSGPEDILEHVVKNYPEQDALTHLKKNLLG